MLGMQVKVSGAERRRQWSYDEKVRRARNQWGKTDGIALVRNGIG